MTLEQLRIFLEVARRQHVTEAARALNLTQSAVSASIAALEARHGVKLFDRVGRRIELTAVGRRFVAEAEGVLTRVSAAELALADLGQAVVGELRVRASQTVASYWLPPLLVDLHSRHPGVQIAFEVGNTTQVARAVLDGAADIGIVEGTVAADALRMRVVAEDSLVLVVSATHPFVSAGRVGSWHLSETPWILREEGSGTRAEFEAHLAAVGRSVAELDIALELPSNEAVLSAVAAGEYASVLSRRAVEAAAATERVRMIDIGIPTRRFLALTHRQRHVGRPAAALLELMDAAEATAAPPSRLRRDAS